MEYGGALSRRCRPAECLASVVENRQVELPQAHGVGEYVDFDDLAARDREAHYRKRPSTLKHDDSSGSVHERRSYEGGEPREGERLLSHVLRTAHLPRCARRHATAVGSEHDVWVEHRNQRVEVAAARGSEEGVNDFSLAGEIGVGNIGRSPHPAACAARELPCCGRGTPHDGRDLLKGHSEHVVQHKRKPLGGSERFEYHEQRETYLVSQ